MKQSKAGLTVIVLAGAVGLAAGPSWSQQTPGSRSGSSGITQPSGKMGSEKGRMGVESQKYSKETIKKIQQALKRKGHEPGTIDGTVNAKTKQALREFQKENHLKVTGTLNQETAQKLGVSLNEDIGGSQSGKARGGMSAQSSGGLRGRAGTSQK